MDRVLSFCWASLSVIASCHRLISWMYSNCDCKKDLKSTVNKALCFKYSSSLSYFSNVGHAFQAGLATGVLNFNSLRLLLRTVFSLHQLYIHSYLSKTVAPYHLNFHFSFKNSPPKLHFIVNKLDE